MSNGATGHAMATTRPGLPESIPARFRQVARQHAKRTAVAAGARPWTYEELDQQSDRIAAAIADRTGPTPDPVVLLLDHAARLIAAILGTLKAGGFYLCLDPLDPQERLRTIWQDAQASVVVTDRKHARLARTLGSAQVLDVEEAQTHGLSRWQPPAIDAGAAAWLMYTSGSTGQPKGVCQSHRNVLGHTQIYGELGGITAEDRLSLLASCGVAASATALFAALLSGAAICPFSLRAEGLSRLAGWLADQRITVYHSVPTVFRRLVSAAGPGVHWPDLRLVRLGGEAMLSSDVGLYHRACPDHCRLMHTLSSTETGLYRQWLIDKRTVVTGRVVPAGYAVPGIQVRILDEAGVPVAPGQEGRIVVRSPYLALNYWRDAELTARTFRPVPHQPEMREFVSNELGLLRPDDCLEHRGRLDQQVKIAGWRVDPMEIEAALLELPGVQEAAVTAPLDAQGERRLVAYVVPRPGAARAATAWRQELQLKLPLHMVPSVFVRQTRLPQTPGGKIDRRALPEPSGPQHGTSRRAPRDRIERKLAEIWQSVLRVDPVGIDDDFFAQGGDSLRGLQILAHIEAAFGVSLPPSTLLEHPTIRRLAEVVAGQVIPASPSPLVALRTTGWRRPLFLVHPANGNLTGFGQLVRHLPPDQPVYALQAPGLRGECWPPTSVGALARTYVEAIATVDPAGPYLLAGRCLGGLIAMEMAQQLQRAGRPVALLAMIDTVHPPVLPRRRAFWQRLADRAHHLTRAARWAVLQKTGIAAMPSMVPAYRGFVGQVLRRACRAYVPAPYEGTVIIFLASQSPPARQERVRAMQQYAAASRIIAVPSDHVQMLRPPIVATLARELQMCLDAAARQDGAAGPLPASNAFSQDPPQAQETI